MGTKRKINASKFKPMVDEVLNTTTHDNGDERNGIISNHQRETIGPNSLLRSGIVRWA